MSETSPAVEEDLSKVDDDEILKSSEKGRTLTPEEREAMIKDMEAGTLKYSEIARKYGITPQAIDRWKKKLAAIGRPIIRKKPTLAAPAPAPAGTIPAAPAPRPAPSGSFDDKKPGRRELVREAHFNAARANLALINRMQKAFLGDPDKGIAATEHDARDIVRLTQSQNANWELMRDLLGVDKDVDENKLPTLVFQDLTDEEIANIQAGDEDLDAEIVEDDPAALDDVGKDIVSEGGS